MSLKKGIGLAGVFNIATGAMISSGIFILPGLAISMAGPAVFISYVLAIPHIIVDGKNRTFLHIERCSEGVFFNEDKPAVKAVFFLGGTKDKRVLHLKTIASLVTLVQQPMFEEKWLDIEKPLELKNMMLLNERKRYI